MSRHELELQLPVGVQIASDEDGFSQRCRDDCAEMGVSPVRLLLLDSDSARSTAWRADAQRWMDEQLRREGGMGVARCDRRDRGAGNMHRIRCHHLVVRLELAMKA